MKLPSIIKLIVALVIVAGLTSFGAPQQVSYAGTNGQQVAAHVCKDYLDPISYFYVEVTGKNQYGNTVTWKSDWNGRYKMPPTFTCNFDTTGWWWKGTVTVTIKRKMIQNDAPQTWTRSANIPAFQIGNWYTVYR